VRRRSRSRRAAKRTGTTTRLGVFLQRSQMRSGPVEHQTTIGLKIAIPKRAKAAPKKAEVKDAP
jgi:hypothetical protein